MNVLFVVPLALLAWVGLNALTWEAPTYNFNTFIDDNLATQDSLALTAVFPIVTGFITTLLASGAIWWSVSAYSRRRGKVCARCKKPLANFSLHCRSRRHPHFLRASSKKK
jgi:hypothetical protein